MKCVVIIPANAKSSGETEFAKDFDNGGRDCFGRGLSATGAAPPTHFIVCPHVPEAKAQQIKARMEGLSGVSVALYDAATQPGGALLAIQSRGLKLVAQDSAPAPSPPRGK